MRQLIAIGLRLKRWRQHLNLSQADLAARTNLKAAAIMRYETGINAPGSESLIALAQTGISIDWLLLGHGSMVSSQNTYNVGLSSQDDGQAQVDVQSLWENERFLSFENIDAASTERYLLSFSKILGMMDDLDRSHFLKDFGRRLLEKRQLDICKHLLMKEYERSSYNHET